MHHWLSRVCSVMAVSLALISPIQAATTTVSTNVSAGSLSLSSATSATLSSVQPGQTGTGWLGTTTATDARGTGTGWVATASVSNFAHVGSPARVSGTAGGILVNGSYNGASSGTYTITITQGGTVGNAMFAVSGLETQSSAGTGGTPALGSKGLTLTFAAGTYVVGDQWTVQVDAIPPTTVTITPANFAVVSGDPTQVTVGAAHTFTGSSDVATLMSAAAGGGLGQFTLNPSLSIAMPASAHTGGYTATVTETIN